MEKKYIIPGMVLLVVATAGLVVWQNVAINPAPQTATSTATTTSFFDMEPIVPEAKVSTEGWKTCRNEEYGWEVKYPENWYAYSGSRDTFTYIPASAVICEDELISISNTSPEDQMKCIESRQCDRQGLSVRSYRDRNSLGIYHKNATSAESFIRNDRLNRIQNRYWLDGDALFIETIDTAYHTDEFWLVHNNDVYEITVRNLHSDILETILSTFYFIDTATSTEQ